MIIVLFWLFIHLHDFSPSMCCSAVARTGLINCPLTHATLQMKPVPLYDGKSSGSGRPLVASITKLARMSIHLLIHLAKPALSGHTSPFLRFNLSSL